MNQEKGTLHIELDFLSSELCKAELPVKVHRLDSTIVAESVSSQLIELEPGTYNVVVQMPAGQELSAQTRIKAGLHQSLKISPNPHEAPVYISQEANFFLGGQQLDFLPRTWWQSLLSLRYGGLAEVLGKRGKPGRLRVVRGNLLVDSYETISAIEFRSETLDQVVRLDVTLGGGPGFLQLVQPGAETINMAFPHTPDNPCFAYVYKPQGSNYSIEVHLENSTADALLGYVANGMLEWASIATTSPSMSAESLVNSERKDPVAAAVGAYALLHLGDSERLSNFAEYFGGEFEWLPDGLIIRGEYLARTNRHALALTEFIKLTKRGLPFFTAGLKYTLRRLKSYTNVEKSPFTRAQKEAAEKLLRRLENINHYIDAEQPVLTFKGVNPLQPDDITFKGDVAHCPGYDLSELVFKSTNNKLLIEPAVASSLSKSYDERQEDRYFSKPIRHVLLAFAGLFTLGIVFVGLSALRASGILYTATAVFWSASIFLASALIGFLFAIPNIGKSKTKSNTLVSASSATEMSEKIPLESWDEQRFRPNTNLDQISDWLTKAMIVVFLINLYRLPQLIDRATSYIAAGLGGEQHKFVATAMLIYFAALGITSSYLITRFYLGSVFGVEHSRDVKELAALALKQLRASLCFPRLPLLGSSVFTGLFEFKPDAAAMPEDERELAVRAAKQMTNSPLTSLADPEEIGLWAFAQCLIGNYPDAIEAYQLALSKSQSDINIRVELAGALSAGSMPFSVVKDYLLDARKQVKPKTDMKVKERLYYALTSCFLYIDPPDGFTQAIEYAEEYIGDTENVENSGIYVNLSVAYAQKYKWDKNGFKNLDILNADRLKSLDALIVAIKIDSRWRSILQLLFYAEPISKAMEWNGLEIFIDDAEFITAISNVSTNNVPHRPEQKAYAVNSYIDKGERKSAIVKAKDTAITRDEHGVPLSLLETILENSMAVYDTTDDLVEQAQYLSSSEFKEVFEKKVINSIKWVM